MSGHLRRGLVAGLAAGLALGAFHYLRSESLIQQALRFEHASGQPGIVSREAQRFGLILASALYGAAAGLIFGFAFPLLARHLGSGGAWARSLRLAALAFATLWLVPFLKYPASPPAVGTPETIGARTASYLGMVVISVAASALAWTASGRLPSLAPPARHLFVGAGYMAVILLAYALLPPSPGPVLVPAGLLWSFRLAAVSGQALMWSCIGIGSGLLAERARRREPALAAAAGQG